MALKRAKKEKRLSKREQAKADADKIALIRAAINQNKFTRKEICEATKLSLSELGNIFRRDRELYAEYTVLRSTITDIAADNIAAIINDPTHPHHFQASKWTLEKYKSDFNETLDSNDGELGIQISANGKVKDPISIVFGSDKEK